VPLNLTKDDAVLWSRLYSRWLTQQLLRARPVVSLRHGTGRNLILGIGRNYDISDLRPFVRSARKYHDCRILLVVDGRPELAAALESEHVDCLADPGWSGLGQPHMNFARIADYIAVLQALDGQVDRVFLADTRDVVFQADIFDAVPDTSAVFVEEAKNFSLEVAGWNGNAIKRAFGIEVYERIKHHGVICSGTVLCRYSDAIQYLWLKLLLGQMVRRKHHMRPGVDQATTNIIARLNLLPSSVVLPYDGAIATLSGRNSDFLKLSRASQHLVTATGVIPAVVHQYDRVSEIREFVYATYCGPAGGRAGDKSRGTTLGKKLRVLFGH
jgi:hypothetical protein